ncbi:MAG: beta-galactosidase [Acidobacteriota bacterium]|nr:beta-galactosidase [Acidobacteriota bacterium]
MRFSTWYWLNSAPQAEWDKDFRTIAESGFSHVVLCWGLDLSAFRYRQAESRYALALCEKYGLKAYLVIWHPSHNTLVLEAKREHRQVDNRGNLRFSLNLFHRQWRRTQWRGYLHQITRTYKDMKGLGGYVFDDSFGIGPVSEVGPIRSGEAVAGDFVSYSDYDKAEFRRWLKQKYGSLHNLNRAWGHTRSDGHPEDYRKWNEIEPPRKILNERIWDDWVEARTQWLTEWASETMRFIREVDPDPAHEVYIEDEQRALGTFSWPSSDATRPISLRDVVGVHFGRVVQPFDAVGVYPAFAWDKPQALEQALAVTENLLSETRRQVGPHKKIVYTFWASDVDVAKREPLTRPTGQEIIRVTEEAMKLGIRHIDYYGYRIGDWRVTLEEWQQLRPGKSRTYPLTKPLRHKFLDDRPDVLRVLAEFIHRVRNQGGQ